MAVIRFSKLALPVIGMVLCLSFEASAGGVADGLWQLTIDRAFDQSVSPPFPSSMLAESVYQPVSNGRTYRVRVSENGSKISIEDLQVEGMLTKNLDVYELRDTASGSRFGAGGRFIIMVGKKGLEAELTTYGSGIPIIKSERGSFKK
jgi:hypothetical protein